MNIVAQDRSEQMVHRYPQLVQTSNRKFPFTTRCRSTVLLDGPFRTNATAGAPSPPSLSLLLPLIIDGHVVVVVVVAAATVVIIIVVAVIIIIIIDAFKYRHLTKLFAFLTFFATAHGIRIGSSTTITTSATTAAATRSSDG